jgi:UDP-2,3-diacylglucosamine pyrophosphatase LpxH
VEKTTLALSFIAYAGLLEKDPKEIARKIKPLLAASAAFIGCYDIVWGPAVPEDDLKPFTDALAYVAQSPENPQEYIVVIRGTNPVSLSTWLFQDFWITKQVPWDSEKAGGAAKISKGTHLGLEKIRGLVPQQGCPGEGKTILEFLRNAVEGKAKEKTRIIVTGHSLGGVLASTLALRMLEDLESLRASGSVEIHAYSYAAPTAGNSQFAEYSDGALGDKCRRHENGLDVVPLAWSSKTLKKIPRLYMPHARPSAALERVIWFARLIARGKGYTQVKERRDVPSRVARFIEGFEPQMAYQHAVPYLAMLVRLVKAGGIAINLETLLCALGFEELIERFPEVGKAVRLACTSERSPSESPAGAESQAGKEKELKKSDDGEMRTFVISDIHLGWMKDAEAPSKGEVTNRDLLKTFLQDRDDELREKGKRLRLVINGDMPELERTEPLGCMNDTYRLLSQYGNLWNKAEFHWIVGNHDFILKDITGATMPSLLGIPVPPRMHFHGRSYELEQKGKLFVVNHGDAVDFMYAFCKMGRRQVPWTGPTGLFFRAISYVCRLLLGLFIWLDCCRASTAEEFHRFCYRGAMTYIGEYENFFKQSPWTLTKLMADFTCSRIGQELLRLPGKIAFGLFGRLASISSAISSSITRIIQRRLDSQAAEPRSAGPSILERMFSRVKNFRYLELAVWAVTFILTTFFLEWFFVIHLSTVAGGSISLPWGFSPWLVALVSTVIFYAGIGVTIMLKAPAGSLLAYVLSCAAFCSTTWVLAAATKAAWNTFGFYVCLVFGVPLLFLLFFLLILDGFLISEGFLNSVVIGEMEQKKKNLDHAVRSYPGEISDRPAEELEKAHFIIGHTHYAEHSEKDRLTDSGAWADERTFEFYDASDPKKYPRASWVEIENGEISLYNMIDNDTCLKFVGYKDKNGKDVPGGCWEIKKIQRGGTVASSP